MHQRPGGASGAEEVDEKIEDLSVQDRGNFEMLASSRGPGKNEYPRTDDRADTKRRQRPRPQRLAQAMLGLVRLSNQFVDGLAAQELAAVGSRGGLGGG